MSARFDEEDSGNYQPHTDRHHPSEPFIEEQLAGDRGECDSCGSPDPVCDSKWQSGAQRRSK